MHAGMANVHDRLKHYLYMTALHTMHLKHFSNEEKLSATFFIQPKEHDSKAAPQCSA